MIINNATICFLLVGYSFAGVKNELLEDEMCRKHVSLLYEGVEEHKLVIFEWKRLLPKYLKLELGRYPVDVNGNHEFPNNQEKFNLMGPIGPKCKTEIEKYGRGDEEKRACGLHKIVEIPGIECVIFSLGSNNQWGFEEAIFQATTCRVETFDCTIAHSSQPPEAIRSRVRFHHVCIGDKDEIRPNKQQFLTWASLLLRTGLTQAPTFLKMDIEGYEFPVLRSIIDSGVNIPLQIAVEIHLDRLEGGHFGNPNVASSELIAFMEELYHFGGYALLDRHDNPHCPHCSEILLAKVNCKNFPIRSSFEHLPYSNLRKPTGHRLFDDSIKRVLDAKYYD